MAKYYWTKLKLKAKRYIILMQAGFAHVGSIIKSGYKSNVFAPVVWFIIAIQPFLITLAFIIKDYYLRCWIVFGDLGIVVAAFLTYLGILICKPVLLQTEKFRIENRKLDIVSQKGGKELPFSPYSFTPSIEEGDQP